MIWQPIETAPAEEDVMLHFPDFGVAVVIGHQFEDREDWYPQHETTYSGAPYESKPTHWMPLPEPPAK